MICTQYNCGLEASRCVKAFFEVGDAHFAICERDYELAQNHHTLTLCAPSGAEIETDAIVRCEDPTHPLAAGAQPDRKDEPMDAPENETPALDVNDATPTNGESKKTRRAPARKKPKKKAVKAAPEVKIDAAQALAFVRSRLKSATDPITKAFYTQELASVEHTVKKLDEERRAKRSITVAGGKTARIGDHLFEVENDGGGRFVRNGKRHDEGVAVHEYVLKDIPDLTYAGAAKDAVVAKVGGGQKTIQSYYLKSLYLDRGAAIEHAINEATDEATAAEEQLAEVVKRRDALLALRNGTSTTPRKADDDRAGKRWTEAENTFLQQLVEAGESPEAIAQKIGRPRDRVVRQMHKLGIKAASTPFHDYGKDRRDVVADDEPAPEVHKDQIPLLEETNA